MSKTAQRRLQMVKSLLPAHAASLLDIGCGAVSSAYPYLEHADEIVCVDWRLRIVGDKPDKIRAIEGNFLDLDLGDMRFEAILCADVFEHIPLEQERAFAERCHRLLKPGGVLVVSTPHKGTYAWLDPYEVKPGFQRKLAFFGLFKGTHNGFCDIRKGHKHYTVDELVASFAPLQPVKVLRWGRLYDPLNSWVEALDRKTGVAPGRKMIESRLAAEYETDPGDRAFNVAVQFRKPLT